MPDAIADARRLIQSRLAEIEAETAQLRRVLTGTGEGSSPRSRGPGRPAGSTGAAPKPRRRAPGRRGAGRRAPRGRRRKELLAAITATPGARSSEHAKSIGIRPTQVSALIAKARAEKLIVRRGQGYALKG